jgi:transcriptional regulator with XRE-family HTH domain
LDARSYVKYGDRRGSFSARRGVEVIHIGQKIRDFRKERGITLADLAGRLNVSPSYLSALERNVRNPSVSLLKRIGEELNIPLSYLAGEADDAITGEKLRFIRESRGLSAEDLAEISDLPLAALERFERGEAAPGLEELKKLSGALNVTLGYFLAGSERNHLGNRLRKLRIGKGLTVTALAERANVSPGLISQIENGRTAPSLETLENLGRALNVSVGSILMQQENVQDLLASLSSDVLEALNDPKVQGILRAARELNDADFRFIIHFIDFFKQQKFSRE